MSFISRGELGGVARGSGKQVDVCLCGIIDPNISCACIVGSTQCSAQNIERSQQFWVHGLGSGALAAT